MPKLIIISDRNKKSQKIKDSLKKKINKIKLKNLIIVIGGDGFMLKTIKRNRNSAKLFYGINSGDYGFLMNKFSSKNTIKNPPTNPCVKDQTVIKRVSPILLPQPG